MTTNPADCYVQDNYVWISKKFGSQKTYKAALWRLDTLICIDINKYFRLKPRFHDPVDGWRHLIWTRAELLSNKLLITMISKIFENFDPKWKYIFRHEFQCRILLSVGSDAKWKNVFDCKNSVQRQIICER